MRRLFAYLLGIGQGHWGIQMVFTHGQFRLPLPFLEIQKYCKVMCEDIDVIKSVMFLKPQPGKYIVVIRVTLVLLTVLVFLTIY